MMRLTSTTLAAGLLLSAMGGASAQDLTGEQACAIARAQAGAARSACLSRAQIKGIRQGLADDELALLFERCEARHVTRVERAEARAAGGPCAGDAGIDDGLQDSDLDSAGIAEALAAPEVLVASRKPRIPLRNFAWKGTFKVASLGVETDLTISGKWQNGYFDLYMEQGHQGSESGVWVENLIYRNKFYTITHEWPVESIPGCYGTLNDITVGDLNGILRSSRLVGLEIIGKVPMNHFRTTCLSETRLGIPPYPPLARLNVFSDIYVRPARPNQLERWLQFGDGVGLDPQQDEWFFLDSHNHRPDPIELPFLCKVLPIPVVQEPCSNLTAAPKETARAGP